MSTTDPILKPLDSQGASAAAAAILQRPFFSYGISDIGASPADLACVAEALLHLRAGPKPACHVDSKGFDQVLAHSRLPAPAALAAHALLAGLVHYAKPARRAALTRKATFVGCEWVQPHEDSSGYGQTAFVSLVLRTGPYPYLVDLFSTRKGSRGRHHLTKQSRILKAGDAFVFDPSVPHMAAPVRLHPDAYLLLLQLEVPLRSARDKEAILRDFPVHPEDLADEPLWEY